MSTTAQTRLRYQPEGGGGAYDALLERSVSVRTVVTERPQRLARALRLLPASAWVQVLDAVALDGRVLVVMPAARGALGGGESAGPVRVAPDRAQRLAAALEPVLADLARRGLAPLSVDPAEVAVTADGDVLLVPSDSGEAVGAAQRAALLAAVDAASEAAHPPSSVPLRRPQPVGRRTGPSRPAGAEALSLKLREAPAAPRESGPRWPTLLEGDALATLRASRAGVLAVVGVLALLGVVGSLAAVVVIV